MDAEVITCEYNPHASMYLDTGCKLLLHYSTYGIVTHKDAVDASQDYFDGIISIEESLYVADCYGLYDGDINKICPGCYTEPSEETSNTNFYIVVLILFIAAFIIGYRGFKK